MQPDGSTLAEALAARALDIRDSAPGDTTAGAVRIHAIDSLGAAWVGTQTSEGRALCAALSQSLPGGYSQPGFVAAALSGCARLTEIDDIHLQSCTTPGAVVFAAALAGQMLRGADSQPDRGRRQAAIIAGYDSMVALGMAARGATAIYADIWPTFLGAAISASVTAGMMIDLPSSNLAHAIAIAANMTAGGSARVSQDPSARWLTLGLAVQNGVNAAAAARHGIVGELTFIDRRRESLGLVEDLPGRSGGDATAIERTEIKPYCAGRQSLSAIEAFRYLLREHCLDPAAITRIEVRVPAQMRAMIDRSARPSTKLDSRGVRYQLALAALRPDELMDIERSHFHTHSAEMARLMDLIEVVADEELTLLYPALWPAIVLIDLRDRRIERKVITPAGGAGHQMTVENVTAKLRAVSSKLSVLAPIEEFAAISESLNFVDMLKLLP